MKSSACSVEVHLLFSPLQWCGHLATGPVHSAGNVSSVTGTASFPADHRDRWGKLCGSTVCVCGIHDTQPHVYFFVDSMDVLQVATDLAKVNLR